MSNIARFTLIAVLYLVFWHGALDSHWSEDDYLNAAAVIERVRTPADLVRSWTWLDAVDGNHRPLATYVWMGGIRLLAEPLGIPPEQLSRGMQAAAWILLLWLLFRVMRLLGGGPLAAWLGVLFLVSRSTLFTLHHWTAAMSDVLSMLFCLAAFNFWLRGRDSGCRHPRLNVVGALAALVLAVSSKQSALVFPAIIFAAVLIDGSGWRQAFREALPFGLVCLVEFAFARHLFAGNLPYPVVVEPYHLLVTPAYAWWTLSGLWPVEFNVTGVLGSAFLGWMVLTTALLLARAGRHQESLRRSSRPILIGLAGFALQTAQMALLPLRFLPYYAGSGAVWLSFAVGAAGSALWQETRNTLRGRMAWFAVVGIVISLSLAEIHLKAAGAVFSGSYPSAASYQRFPKLVETFRPHLGPGVRTLVLVDFPYLRSWYTGLVRWHFPGITRILCIGKPDTGPRSAATAGPTPLPPDTRLVFHNGLHGRFESAVRSTTDGQPAPFQWDFPLPAAEAAALLASEADSLRILRYNSDTYFTPIQLASLSSLVFSQ
ncbi:MAG TPA: hypothetical protein VIV61_13125 [Candidatus Ozemobacteraceae bacterium]